MSRIPLPGLANTDKMTEIPKNKNPFLTVASWTPELAKQIEVVISDLTETTSDFTRKKSPKNRYWKGKITFKYAQWESSIIKMAGCEVPFVKSTNYGTDYFYAHLQKPIADAIIAAGMKKDIIVTKSDPKMTAPDSEWWATINGTSGRIGIVDGSGNFHTKDFDQLLKKTEKGVLVNLDLVLTIRLTTSDGADKKPQSAFRIVPDCSRASIKTVNQEVEPPPIDSQVPQQAAARGDIVSQEVLDLLDGLLL